jgi:hypothetical protein
LKVLELAAILHEMERRHPGIEFMFPLAGTTDKVTRMVEMIVGMAQHENEEHYFCVFMPSGDAKWVVSMPNAFKSDIQRKHINLEDTMNDLMNDL